jgi:hypothetical protein
MEFFVPETPWPGIPWNFSSRRLRGQEFQWNFLSRSLQDEKFRGIPEKWIPIDPIMRNMN